MRICDSSRALPKEPRGAEPNPKILASASVVLKFRDAAFAELDRAFEEGSWSQTVAVVEPMVYCFGRRDHGRKPHVAFIRNDRLPEGKIPQGDLFVAPDLVVEVLSPSNSGTEVQRKLDEYLSAVRDLEQRIERAALMGEPKVPEGVAQPAGIPKTYEEHIRLMMDLMVLAFQTDMTRVVTHSLGGVVVRDLLSLEGSWKDRIRVGRVVMIAPPNSVPKSTPNSETTGVPAAADRWAGPVVPAITASALPWWTSAGVMSPSPECRDSSIPRETLAPPARGMLSLGRSFRSLDSKAMSCGFMPGPGSPIPRRGSARRRSTAPCAWPTCSSR